MSDHVDDGVADPDDVDTGLHRFLKVTGPEIGSEYNRVQRRDKIQRTKVGGRLRERSE